MRSYEAARSLFSFLAFFAWCVIILGAGVALFSSVAVGNSGSFGRNLSGLAVFTSLLPGFGISLLGLLGLALVQMGRATVDTAEYTQQMLKIARDQLEVSRRGLKGASDAPQSFSAATPREEPSVSAQYRKVEIDPPLQNGSDPQAPEIPKSAEMYNGHAIERRGNRYIVEGASFMTVGNAKRHINKLAR